MKKNIDAYKVEYYRSKLANNKNYTELIKTYTRKIAEIKDLNTHNFWNTKLETLQPLEKQDEMTQERIKTIYSFLPSSVRTLLDVGIGHGWIEEMLINKNLNIYGNDISDKTINNIKRKFKGNFSVKSIYQLDYDKNFFDCILLLEVLEHIPPSKTFKVLRTLLSLLKPKGYLILSVPMNEGLEQMTDNPSGHVRMYTESLIFAELKICGFKIIKFKTLYAFKKYYKLKSLLSKVWGTRWKPNNIVILAQKS